MKDVLYFKRFAGLDLGKKSDFSALAVVEAGRRMLPTGGFEDYLHCNHLMRWPLLTPYPEIVADVAKMFETKQEGRTVRKGPLSDQTLIVDGTGVGEPVVDMFRAERLPGQLVSVIITGGATENRVDRTFRVAKLHLASVLTEVLENERLKIYPCPLRATLVAELKTFSVKITKAGNETFECLTAQAQVETAFGLRPIDHVRVGDYVLTRAGYRRVVKSGETKLVSTLCRIATEDGCSVSGTADHRIWTENRGWVEMGQLRIGDAILSRKSFSSVGWNTANRPATPTTTTSIPSTPCTEPSGSSSTDQSQKTTISTTSTKTLKTTTSATFSVSWMWTTAATTILGFFRTFVSVLVARPVSPAPAEAAILTHASGSVLSDVQLSIGPSGVASAGSATPLSEPRDLDGTARSVSAPLYAEKPGDTPTESYLKSYAPAAVSYFVQNTRWANTVRVSALPETIRLGEPVPVYDLSVEGCHEFFANGILVANSWRERDHDDLVLALALGCWAAERFGTRASGSAIGSSPPAYRAGNAVPNNVVNRMMLHRLRGGGGPLAGGS